MRILILSLLVSAFHVGPAASQSSSGDCSPVVSQTDGNVTIICNGQLKDSGKNSTKAKPEVSAKRMAPFKLGELVGKWVGRVDCKSSYLPWYTFSASYAQENQIMLTGDFTVTAEATSRFASNVGRALPSTMTVVGMDGHVVQVRLGAQARGRARRLLNIAVSGSGGGPFTGTAGEGDECSVVMAKS